MPHEEVPSGTYTGSQLNHYSTNTNWGAYNAICGTGQQCQVGLVCCQGRCVQQTSVNTCLNAQSQLGVLRQQVQRQYVATQNYVPTTAAAERAREYELAQQAALISRLQTDNFGGVDYAYVTSKLAEIEEEKRRIELEYAKQVAEQQAEK